MLLYYLFWMFMGFILHFYIIFGTNLLTQSPVPVPVFPLFQCFEEKEYQMESKQNETFRRVILERKQSRRLGVYVREATRWPRGREARPHPHGPLVAPLTYFFLLYIPIYPKTIGKHNRSGVPSPEASVATENQSRPVPAPFQRGESLSGGHLHHPGALHDEEGVVLPRG